VRLARTDRVQGIGLRGGVHWQVSLLWGMTRMWQVALGHGAVVIVSRRK